MYIEGLEMAHIGFKVVFSGPPLRESCLNYIHTNSNLPLTLPSTYPNNVLVHLPPHPDHITT